MAFFAHTQQAEKTECVAITLRVFVQRAECLPKMDILTESDPYVTCSVVEDDPGKAAPTSKTQPAFPSDSA
eukprot:CAMPEP_0198566452 /NCGR_PEP_ID=MMETSP1462-20131121/103333_1 /TAXON_ID=1333877 /ORGANISM="Brandtodinium nutriculum, Strain RCC3387" /LENGTH=70 /DNA_ID=CAMNT_0044297475 /DNA_START=21 /DNA_END=230 /DNA_ORIENTATION=+